MYATQFHLQNLNKQELTNELLKCIETCPDRFLKEEMQSILNAKADPNIGDQCTTPIITATKMNQATALEILLKTNANVNLFHHVRKNINPLYIVNKISTFEILIENGANINIQNESGQTPLMSIFSHFMNTHKVKQSEDLEIAFELISLGANLNLVPKNGIDFWTFLQNSFSLDLEMKRFAKQRLNCVQMIIDCAREDLDFSEMLIFEILPFYAHLENLEKLIPGGRKRKFEQLEANVKICRRVFPTFKF